MAKAIEIKGTVVVNADLFRRYQRVQAGVNAAKKRADALKSQLGLPLAGEGTVGAYIIADGNNNPIGKISIFHKDSFVMPAGYQARIS